MFQDNLENNHYQFSPIGTVQSPYKEKFAIPRQPGLVSAAIGSITLMGQYNQADIVRDLSQFSHIWVIFVFHATEQQGWKPLVRPPRLGGNKKTGVLATRSTFRPNPIGMSVVKLEDIITVNGEVSLVISSLDLLDGTPVLDIKPYITYADSIPTANSGYAQSQPCKTLTVEFSDQVLKQLADLASVKPEFKSLITQVLQQDPRPAYKHQQLDDKVYGMHLYDFNITWRLKSASKVEVINLTSIK